MAECTRDEINFNRLLQRCEDIAGHNDKKNWRLEKYIDHLQCLLVGMKKSLSHMSQDTMNHCQKRIDILKGFIRIDNMQPGEEKVMAAARLPVPPVRPWFSSSCLLHAKAKSISREEERQELFGSRSNPEHPPSVLNTDHHLSVGGASDIDKFLQQHSQTQVHLTDEILCQARTMKQNITESGQLVKEDVKRVSENVQLADVHYTRLHNESDRLENYTQSSQVWTWIPILLVVLSFLPMVLIIRFF